MSPRTITVTVYQFDELPTDKAKESARKWLRDAYANDPPWRSEWSAVHKKVRDAFREQLVAWSAAGVWDTCPMTGFTGDYDALKAVHEVLLGDPDAELSRLQFIAFHALRVAEEMDYESQMEDESIDDALRANEYEFDHNGRRFVAPR